MLLNLLPFVDAVFSFAVYLCSIFHETILSQVGHVLGMERNVHLMECKLVFKFKLFGIRVSVNYYFSRDIIYLSYALFLRHKELSEVKPLIFTLKPAKTRPSILRGWIFYNTDSNRVWFVELKNILLKHV